MRLFPGLNSNQPPGGSQQTGLGFNSGGRDVIVCDDERHIVRLIQVNLERNGWTVRTTFRGEDCLAMVREKCPNLLILDQEMPQMTGDEVIEALRANPATEHLKIVLMNKASRNSGDGPDRTSGPTTMISKPFNPVEMMRLIG